MRKIALILFLVIFSCSKDAEPQNELEKFKVNIEASDGGSVNLQGGTFNKGVKIQVTATPNQNYVFVNWSNGETNPVLSFTVNSDINLIANFAIKTFTLEIISNEGGEVSQGGVLMLTKQFQ